ncbi:MAG: A/G-specific adenine glycosylase [Planctomycetota bacterium]
MEPCADANRRRRIRRKLLTWYDRHKRDLPWRRTHDPYAIWLSEAMLQQTQVATVIPYYERFLCRFLTVRDLAGADLDLVLQMWAGLGYYARARNLHRAARAVVADFDGRFPHTVEGLMRLPGVGRYTAGAIASVAFGVRAAIVDGNVARVWSRIFDIASDVREGAGKEAVWRIAEQLVPRVRPGDFNQAVMELGATCCVPGAGAQCDACPLRTECDALAAGTVAERPVKGRKTRVMPETHVVAAIEHCGSWLFVQRPADGLWGALWEMPTVVLNSGTVETAAADLAKRRVGTPCHVEARPFCKFQHQLTHRTILFVGHRCRATRTLLKRSTPENARWLALDAADSLGMSKAMRNVIAALRESKDQAAS